jgi:DNA-binding beta-propeller fold protein YncE
LGSRGSGDSQFCYPYDVAVDKSGNIYVADSGNHRIQEFTNTGTFICKWGSYGSGNGQFNYPHGITVDAAGYVYVGDYNNHRVQKFTNNGTYVTQWGDGGTGNGQFNTPKGVAIDKTGNIYVADTSNSRVQKFKVEQTSYQAASLLAADKDTVISSQVNEVNSQITLPPTVVCILSIVFLLATALTLTAKAIMTITKL